MGIPYRSCLLIWIGHELFLSYSGPVEVVICFDKHVQTPTCLAKLREYKTMDHLNAPGLHALLYLPYFW